MDIITPKGAIPKSPVEPRNDWCVLEILPNDMTPGGLYKPETAYEELPKMRVLAVGPGRLRETIDREPPDIRRGDIVYIYGPAVELEKPSEGRNAVILIREDAIICVAERGVGEN